LSEYLSVFNQDIHSMLSTYFICNSIVNIFGHQLLNASLYKLQMHEFYIKKPILAD